MGLPTEIAERGGDPARIYLMGQSAGAMHVASYVSHPEFHKGEGRRPGRRDHGVGPLRSDGLAGRRSRDRLFRLRSLALRRAILAARPAGNKIAADDRRPPNSIRPFVEQFELLKQAACKGAERMRAAFMLPQHSHMSEVYAINTGGYAADG